MRPLPSEHRVVFFGKDEPFVIFWAVFLSIQFKKNKAGAYAEKPDRRVEMGDDPM